MKRIHRKRIIGFTIALTIMFSLLPTIPVSAYNINGHNVDRTSVEYLGRSQCWEYANRLYNIIWGHRFSNQFSDSENMLRNLSDSQLEFTKEHTKEYISQAQIGAVIRICNSTYLHSDDGWGHSFILVAKDNNGFTTLESVTDANDGRRERYWTYDSFAEKNSNFYGGESWQYHYIKYIKWPGAPAYNGGHVHNWAQGYDSGHPHNIYNYCTSCGEKHYTGGKKLVASCSQCYPLGNVNLTRSFNRVSRSATFYRNNVTNANSYTLTLYKDGASYGTYNMSSTEKTVSSLASGTYTATLTAKNTNTNQSKTANALSFTIVDTYDVAFDANGGTNAPSAQTKIKDEDLTLTSAKPTKAHYIFKGWAANKSETEPQYLAGGMYTKNTRITLYAVWEPETYTINFDTNGGKGEVESTTITYGNTIKMPNTVVRDGYYLKGWSKIKGATTPDYKLGLDHMLDSNMTLYAVWGQSTWGGAVATEFAGGDGTEENPYQISNAAELAHLADKVNNQQSEPKYEYYILTDNIDLGYEEWIPIGLYGNGNQYFKGSFDGNGYTISDLNITDINEGYVGLFGYTKDGEITGLNITGNIENISSTLENAYIGTIVSYADKTNIIDCSAQYVNISDIISNDNYFYIGVICGQSSGNISKCTVNGSYIGIDKVWELVAGHIVGTIDGNISDCSVYSSEELIGTFNYGLDLFLGGICGLAGGEIERCSVSAGSLGTNLYAAYICAGGIVGLSGFNVKQCSVNLNNGVSKAFDGIQTNISISAQGHGVGSLYIGGISGQGYALYNDPTTASGLNSRKSTISNCIYNGQSIVYYNEYAGYYSQYYSGGIVGNGGVVNKDIAIIDGMVYGETPQNSFGRVGGVAGYSGEVKNAIVVADKIKNKADSWVVNYAGDVVGHDGTSGDSYTELKELEKLDYENVYTNSGMEVEAVNTYNDKMAKTHTIGTRRTLALIKRASFLKQLFGPEYQSLAHLEEDPEAVWVIKDGEYPELYFTVLNDITVSDVEHGTISVDKTQAVDDEIVTVTAVPDDGYKLNKIYVNGEEITGTTFTVVGDSDVYATFAEIPAEYRVSVAANANASAGLVNVDTVSLQSVSLFSDNQALTATDGEEIKVNTQAATDYTVDAIYVNGEELAGDSFIVTDDSVVTMDAVSIRTDVKAVTNDAANVGSYYATLSGSVEGDNATKYIRYWSTSNPSEIYTTATEEGDGAYSVTVSDLELGTEYQFQMTEYGEVKSFTTSEAEPDGEGVPDSAYDGGNTPVEPIPTYDYPVFAIKNQQLGTGSISLDIQNNADDTAAGTLIIAAYDSGDSLVTVKTKAIANIPKDTSKSFDVDVPETAYYKLFIWKDIKSMLPMADGVIVR